jgi:hypothetical protein
MSKEKDRNRNRNSVTDSTSVQGKMVFAATSNPAGCSTCSTIWFTLDSQPPSGSIPRSSSGFTSLPPHPASTNGRKGKTTARRSLPVEGFIRPRIVFRSPFGCEHLSSTFRHATVSNSLPANGSSDPMFTECGEEHKARHGGESELEHGNGQGKGRGGRWAQAKVGTQHRRNESSHH